MDGNNLNTIMKTDPSYRSGTYTKVFERKCNVEMMIIDPAIVQMVNQEVSSTEPLQFKLMVKNSDDYRKGSDINSTDEKPECVRLEIMSDHDYFF